MIIIRTYLCASVLAVMTSISAGQVFLTQFEKMASTVEKLAEYETFSAALRDSFLGYNESSPVVYDNYDPFYAMCPVYDSLNARGLGCDYIVAAKTLLTSVLQDFSGPFENIEAVDTTGNMPERLLLDPRPTAPRIIPKAVTQYEKPTYNFLYKLIMEVYQHAFEEYSLERTIEEKLQNSDKLRLADKVLRFADPLPPLLPTWSDQRMHTLLYDKIGRATGSRDTPFAYSMVKGEQMLVVLRGTIHNEEWAFDFAYNWEDEDKTSPYFAGRVHKGFFSVFKMLNEPVLKSVRDHPEVNRITVTGHSLGAASGMLLALYLKKQLPTLQVEMVAFGAPFVGNEAWSEEYYQHVNSRHLIFVGPGSAATKNSYGAGDLLISFTCGPYPGCPRINTGGKDDTYQYTRHRSNVPFESGDMANGDRWATVESIWGGDQPIPSNHNIVASHVCSYLCYTSTGTGEEASSLCYFKGQGHLVAGKQDVNLCNFPKIAF